MASNSNDQDDLGLVEDKLDPLSGENMQEGDGVAEEEGKDSGVKGVETNESSRFVDYSFATDWESFVGDIEQTIRKLVADYELSKILPDDRIDIQYKDAVYAMEMKISGEDGSIKTDTFETKKRNWVQSLLSYSGPYILFYKRLPKTAVASIDANKVVNSAFLDSSMNASSAFTTAVKGVLEQLAVPPTLPILYTYEHVGLLESDTVSEVTIGYRIEPESGRRLKYECYVYDNPSYNPQYLDPNTTALANTNSSTANSNIANAVPNTSSANVSTSGSKQYNKYYSFFYMDNIRKLYAKKVTAVNRGLGVGIGVGVGGGLGGLKGGPGTEGGLLGAEDYSVSLIDHYDFSMGVWTHTAQKVLSTWEDQRDNSERSLSTRPALLSPFSPSFQEYYDQSHFYSYLKRYRIYNIKNLEIHVSYQDSIPSSVLDNEAYSTYVLGKQTYHKYHLVPGFGSSSLVIGRQLGTSKGISVQATAVVVSPPPSPVKAAASRPNPAHPHPSQQSDPTPVHFISQLSLTTWRTYNVRKLLVMFITSSLQIFKAMEAEGGNSSTGDISSPPSPVPNSPLPLGSSQESLGGTSGKEGKIDELPPRDWHHYLRSVLSAESRQLLFCAEDYMSYLHSQHYLWNGGGSGSGGSGSGGRERLGSTSNSIYTSRYSVLGAEEVSTPSSPPVNRPPSTSPPPPSDDELVELTLGYLFSSQYSYIFAATPSRAPVDPVELLLRSLSVLVSFLPYSRLSSLLKLWTTVLSRLEEIGITQGLDGVWKAWMESAGNHREEAEKAKLPSFLYPQWSDLSFAADSTSSCLSPPLPATPLSPSCLLLEKLKIFFLCSYAAHNPPSFTPSAIDNSEISTAIMLPRLPVLTSEFLLQCHDKLKGEKSIMSRLRMLMPYLSDDMAKYKKATVKAQDSEGAGLVDGLRSFLKWYGLWDVLVPAEVPEGEGEYPQTSVSSSNNTALTLSSALSLLSPRGAEEEREVWEGLRQLWDGIVMESAEVSEEQEQPPKQQEEEPKDTKVMWKEAATSSLFSLRSLPINLLCVELLVQGCSAVSEAVRSEVEGAFSQEAELPVQLRSLLGSLQEKLAKLIDASAYIRAQGGYVNASSAAASSPSPLIICTVQVIKLVEELVGVLGDFEAYLVRLSLLDSLVTQQLPMQHDPSHNHILHLHQAVLTGHLPLTSEQQSSFVYRVMKEGRGMSPPSRGGHDWHSYDGRDGGLPAYRQYRLKGKYGRAEGVGVSASSMAGSAVGSRGGSVVGSPVTKLNLKKMLHDEGEAVGGSSDKGTGLDQPEEDKADLELAALGDIQQLRLALITHELN
eukprot:gene27619-33354_t